ncbi:metallophosphatase family protein [Mesobacillus maritimus]|uniref:metallophosphoesterase family protein n=1 Tax=Mesobacillus maritimus TaxID=1643336 RepID=UPI00203BB59B|nr:metallophosphoesterase family protein [Mesobacillus maritimus]MCM3588053.1 metallophosphatase family protein [Mesobacillus maritimus]MCM3668384.1 metallophosphatase family protein [Mesobacillus maritimus]
MKIVVVSDTHIPKRAKNFPTRLTMDLETADLIIHAGDWQTLDVYHNLCRYGKVIGVTGNVDSSELARKLNSREVVSIRGYRFGIVHGHGTGKTTEKRAKAAFLDDKVNCIIYGHSHIPILKSEENLILFNPGSATDKRRQKSYSYGIITFKDDVEFQHIFFNEKD